MPLAIDGALDVSGDGVTVRIEAHGTALDITVGGSKAGMLRAVARGRRSLSIVRAAARACERYGLTAKLNVGGVTVGRFGHGVSGDAFATVFGLGGGRRP